MQHKTVASHFAPNPNPLLASALLETDITDLSKICVVKVLEINKVIMFD